MSVFDFRGAGTIVDVAGGRGVLLAEILRQHPHARGILFSLPSVIDSARAALATSVVDRMALVAGDFFRGLPPEGDIYILKNIIHDWDDSARPTYPRVVVAQWQAGRRPLSSSVVQFGPQHCLAMMADVHMMVRTGGRNRTEDGRRELLAGSGLR